MSVKTILVEPDIILRQKSQPVNIVGPDEKKLMNDMLDTMYAANGIGLAAIQIGKDAYPPIPKIILGFFEIKSIIDL